MEYGLGQRLRELPGPVMLTGHTGFKGTWMTLFLEYLGISVVGYSLPAEKESLFDRASRKGIIPEAFADVRDYQKLQKFVYEHKPSAIIHMAAQPLVLKSYESPLETFDINVMGTANILDIVFKRDFVKAIIVVTTDKVYRNENAGHIFVETDPLEGKDPYSASKVGAEAVVSAWQQLAKVYGGPSVVSVRAGNVIGGGDFADNRIIPDLIRGVITGDLIEIRNPESTRPWQHVLDPAKGYLMALENSLTISNYQSFNFGPNELSISVREVTEIAKRFFPTLKVKLEKLNLPNQMEALTLNLDSNLSKNHLNWHPSFNQKEALEMSFDWWKKLIDGVSPIEDLCLKDLKSCLNAEPN
jgi:CDP-glucose 4,6-dehydratase